MRYIKVLVVLTIIIAINYLKAHAVNPEEFQLQQEKHWMIEEEIKRDTAKPTEYKTMVEQPTENLKTGDDCFKLNEVKFSNITIFTQKELGKMVEKYKG